MGLETDELSVVTAKTAKLGLEAIATELPDAVIVDVRLPDLSGLDLFERIKRIDARLPVIIATAFSNTETAIEAMKRGAFEYLLKPVDLHQLREVVTRAVELRRMQTVPTAFDQSPYESKADQIIGQSPVMQEVYKAIGRFAAQDVTLLILGESGTGKELVARALYQHSKRSEKPFLAINCAAIPESLLESELFGHEKGAFTGADRQRIGKFEQACGGTLFLDEIGDMSQATQAKVLRVLQDQKFERIGGRESISVDVRVIAATNRKLEEMVAVGRFREDLLYRLNGVTIHLPPLRDRKDDIPRLVNHFIRLTNDKLGKEVHGITPEAMQVLVAHAWPGNVRELQNAVRYAVIRAVSSILIPDYLPTVVLNRSHTNPEPSSLGDVRDLIRSQLASGTTEIYRKVIQLMDHIILEEVLNHVDGNQVQASELLGISRTTLRAKLASNDMH
jgi:two-component system nitrogen regulation response regulator GlnG